MYHFNCRLCVTTQAAPFTVMTGLGNAEKSLSYVMSLFALTSCPFAGTKSTNDKAVSNSTTGPDLNRSTVEAAYATFCQMEAPLQQQLIDCLNQKPAVTTMGPKSAETSCRVATVSFVHKHKTSEELNTAIQKAGFAIRHGHMYAMRLTERLIEKKYVRSADDGVVRISLLHYNTPTEVQQLVNALDRIL